MGDQYSSPLHPDVTATRYFLIWIPPHYWSFVTFIHFGFVLVDTEVSGTPPQIWRPESHPRTSELAISLSTTCVLLLLPNPLFIPQQSKQYSELLQLHCAPHPTPSSLSSPPPGHPLSPEPLCHWAVSLYYARYIFHYSQFFFSLFCCDGKNFCVTGCWG